MDVPHSSVTADTRVALVQFIVGKELGWIFRSQLSADIGIDAHVEVVQEGKATGRLLALQIKSGESWLRESTTHGVVFRPKAKHVKYWLGHSLPVAVVLVDVDKEDAYWQFVTKETVVSTGKGWKMTIPTSNTFAAPSASALLAATESDAYTLKMRQLKLARPWMEHLAKGGGLTVELEEWMHKTSGRASLLLTALDNVGEVVAQHEWPWIFLPFANYAVELPRIFPWANLTTNEEADWARYEKECAVWDKEAQSHFFPLTYDEWQANQSEPGLQPSWDNEEVAQWHLNLALSELGRAFLVLDDFLLSGVIHALFDG